MVRYFSKLRRDATCIVWYVASADVDQFCEALNVTRASGIGDEKIKMITVIRLHRHCNRTPVDLHKELSLLSNG